MFSSNSFNVCPHCGKANSLNARYCSSCGKQLSVPEEVSVCPKCHKTNSPMASFCGGCGAPLRVGAQTKICPKCHRELDINESVCSCGYTFGAVKYATPEKEKRAAKVQNAAAGKKSNARVSAAVALVLALIFAYLLIIPFGALRPESVTNLDGGLLCRLDGEKLYVYSLIMEAVGAFNGGGGFDALTSVYGVGGVLIMVFAALFAVMFVLHLLVVLFRLATGKRQKKASLVLFIMALLNTLWIALFAVFKYLVSADLPDGNFLLTLRNVFVPKTDVGFIIFGIPLYYWVFTIFSAATKGGKIKEAVA